jgi:hypothetical protein
MAARLIRVDWEAWAERGAKSYAAVGARGFMLTREERRREELREQFTIDLRKELGLPPTTDPREPQLRGGMLPGLAEWLDRVKGGERCNPR